MIVGARQDGQGGDQEFHEILAVLSAAPKTPDFIFAASSHPNELATSVAQARGGVDLLDIYYHGREGTMFLGGTSPDHVLFASDATSATLVGQRYARALLPLLAPNAHVRLLGCGVGTYPEGRMLLIKLAYELGGRVAFAPIQKVLPGHFRHGRFAQPSILFSSLGALDRHAPTPREREFNTPQYP